MAQPNFKNLKPKLEFKTHDYIECKWELEWKWGAKKFESKPILLILSFGFPMTTIHDISETYRLYIHDISKLRCL
jgi:hypothetical protein